VARWLTDYADRLFGSEQAALIADTADAIARP
jgi:hypothetical protein